MFHLNLKGCGQFPLDAKPALVRQPCYEAPVTQWSKVGLTAAK